MRIGEAMRAASRRRAGDKSPAASQLRRRVDWLEVVETVYHGFQDNESWANHIVELGRYVFGEVERVGLNCVRYDASCTSLEIEGAFGDVRIRDFNDELMPVVGVGAMLGMFCPDEIVSTLVELTSRLAPSIRTSLASANRAYGYGDAIALFAQPSPGVAIVFYAGRDEIAVLTRREREVLSQVALHIEASYRLRVQSNAARAVISSDGRVVHRDEEIHKDLPRMLAAVERIEHARAHHRHDTEKVLALWGALVGGRASLVSRREGSRRYYMVMDNMREAYPHRALSEGERDVLAFAARGLSAKLIAYGLGISESAVSVRLASAAAKLGLATRIELIRIAALLTRDPRANADDPVLTAAEREIMGFVAQGLSNQDIAVLRHRSVRTIANQVASLLRKTDAPSRRALVTKGR